MYKHINQDINTIIFEQQTIEENGSIKFLRIDINGNINIIYKQHNENVEIARSEQGLLDKTEKFYQNL